MPIEYSARESALQISQSSEKDVNEQLNYGQRKTLTSKGEQKHGTY